MITPASLPEYWQDLVAGYVLGDLASDETTLVEQWCQQYPEVRAELVALQEAWHTLPQALPLQVPPAALKAQILAAAAETTQPAPVLTARWPAYGLGLGWAVTAIALGFALLDNQTLRQRTATLETLLIQFQDLQNPVYTLAGTPSHPDAVGRLVIDTQRHHARIVTEDLPPLPSGEVYRLWAVVEGEGEPVFCGQFNPGPEVTSDFPAALGGQSQQWDLLSQHCESAQAQMLITHEVAAAPPVPQGPLVLVSGN